MEKNKNIWICRSCNYENQDQSLKCTECKDDKPQIPAIIKEEENENKKLISVQPLLEIFKGKVHYSEHVGNQLLDVFDHQKPLVIIVAAGQVGTGKSTWMNSLVYELNKSDRSKIEFSNFSIGHGNKTHTEGLWVYPYSFRLEKCSDVQIMLCDMEGMGGLKDMDEKELESGLKKLYTFVKHLFYFFHS